MVKFTHVANDNGTVWYTIQVSYEGDVGFQF